MDSTIESEYIVASEGAKETIWIRKFIEELGVVPCIVDLIPLNCDNNGAIKQAKEPRSHQRSKHVLRRYHSIREIFGKHNVIIEKVLINQNIVDLLTKTLPQTKFDSHVLTYGMRYKVN